MISDVVFLPAKAKPMHL